MRILVAYDINTENENGSKRLRKVAKSCSNYGKRVQNSLFECFISTAQLETLKNTLQSVIDENLDCVIIYHLSENAKKESMGTKSYTNMKDDTLIF